MKILITNDDGFHSSSLNVLCQYLSPRHSIFVVAPALEQSGVGQAISINHSLSYRELSGHAFPAYEVSGTPSDCVKLAVCHLFKEEKFDLVISGINPCENAGLSSIYSGTVAGAREGATWGIPSLALSVWDDDREKVEYAAGWVSALLEKPKFLDLQPGVYWDINFPNCETADINGCRVSHMSLARFEDHYQEFKTPRGTSEYWLVGAKRQDEFEEGSDDWVLRDHMIAITPLQIDQTCREELERLAALEKEFVDIQSEKHVMNN
jgi:5'-nucleotidase